MKLKIEKIYLNKLERKKKILLHMKNLCMKIIKEDHQTQHQKALQTNLAGGNYKNKYDNTYTTLSGSNAEGFDKLYNKTSVGTDRIHLFTDVYNVEQPPFFNTNDFVYLSFILRSTAQCRSTSHQWWFVKS